MLLDRLNDLDRKVTLAINSLDSPVTDPIMQFFSNIPIWIPMYAIILAVCFYRLGWQKALIVALSSTLTLIICDQFANFVKESVGRLRPCYDEEMLLNGLNILEKKGQLYGFFSGHAANSFGFAVTSYIGLRNDKRLKYKGYAAWIFSWATLMSISRIFVGKHFLGDIIIGAIAGTLIGLCMAYAARFVIKRFIDKKRN